MPGSISMACIASPRCASIYFSSGVELTCPDPDACLWLMLHSTYLLRTVALECKICRAFLGYLVSAQGSLNLGFVADQDVIS